jgi:squalene cyclase
MNTDSAFTYRATCRAARFLMSMQQPNGDFPQQSISGVFNHNCMITYANYRYDTFRAQETCTVYRQSPAVL